MIQIQFHNQFTSLIHLSIAVFLSNVCDLFSLSLFVLSPVAQFKVDRCKLGVIVDYDEDNDGALERAYMRLNDLSLESRLDNDHDKKSKHMGNELRHEVRGVKAQRIRRTNKKNVRTKWLMFQLRSLLWLRNRGGRRDRSY